LIDLVRRFWKKEYDAVTAFREAKCNDYCLICGDNCCSGRLNPSFRDLRAFSSLKRVRYRWNRPPEGEPFLVDRRILLWGGYVLVRQCPHLKSGRCSIYGDPHRPRECFDYPLYLDVPLSIPFFRPFISVELSCGIFRYEKNRREIEDLAGRLNLEVMLHPSGEGDEDAGAGGSVTALPRDTS
jgi:hypothetical protein